VSSHYWIGKHHLRCPNNLVIIVGNVVLPLNFLLVEIPFDPLPNFIANFISTPLLTTSMVDATTVSTLVLVIPASSDQVTTTPSSYLRVSTIVAFNTIDKLC
jgi:hypothetical protein